MTNKDNQHLKEWHQKEREVIKLLKIASELKLERTIDLVLFRSDIYEKSLSQIIQLHQKAINLIDKPISTELSLDIAKRILKSKDLPPSRIDIGKLAVRWIKSKKPLEINEFVDEELKKITGVKAKNQTSRDIVIYGFGRIGRLVARRLIESTGKGEQLVLKAIVVIPKLKDRYQEAKKRAALFSSDSVHGDFAGEVTVMPDGQSLIINGNTVQIIYAQSPDEIDYTEYGIHKALIIDSTGVWRNREELSIHLRPGAEKVLLTAPGIDVPNIVYGVNEEDYDFTQEHILSAASCTTNAIVPVLSLLESNYGITRGHVETIHAYTNDQNLLDNFHKKPRRGRGAPVNMVLTSTAAHEAVCKVIPSLAGKLTGNAVRVPTPNVSMAIVSVSLKKSTDKDSLLAMLQRNAFDGNLAEQIQYSNSTEYVSSNAIGMSTTSIIDAPSTIVSADGKSINVYLWYDNEYGYSCQVVRLAKKATGVNRHVYY